MTTRQDVIAAARRMLGTPFRHQARLPGEYLDCAGLIICVARELHFVPEAFDVTGYGRVPDGRSLLEYADQGLTRIARNQLQPGDVAVLRWGREPQHFGIVGDYAHGGISLIHAYSHPDGQGAVIEQRFDQHLAQKLVAAYAFPGVV